jgi:hypothetical protein
MYNGGVGTNPRIPEARVEPMATATRTWTKIDGPDRSVEWRADDALVTVARSAEGWTMEAYEGCDVDGSLGYIGSETTESRAGIMPVARRWVRALTRPAES